jgi:hemoglobin
MTDEMTAEERRQKITQEIMLRTGITEAMISSVVRTFYDRIQHDPVLGPIFAEHIEDWEPHLQRMEAFWSSITLMSGRYHGKPMAKHLPLPVHGAHFDRWLALFEDTAKSQCPEGAAAVFIERAHRVAESIELAMAGHHGILLAPGERLTLPHLDASVATPGTA